MKNSFTRNCFCLFLSALFHALIFTFALTDIFPVQSAPQERPRILAEVVLLPAPARQAEQVRNVENHTEIAQQENKTIEPVRVPEIVNAPEPKKETVKKQEQPLKKANTAKITPEKKAPVKQDTSVPANNEKSALSPAQTSAPPAANAPDTASKGAVSQLQRVPSVIGVDSAIVVNRVKPIYPQISRKRNEEGNVVLLADVKGGKVVNVSIEKSSGISALDSSALTAVSKWSFSKETNTTVRIPVSFKLKE